MLNMAGVTEGIMLAGCSTFMVKFIQNQFSQSAAHAARYAGTCSNISLSLTQSLIHSFSSLSLSLSLYLSLSLSVFFLSLSSSLTLSLPDLVILPRSYT